jgi:hypothetical protein
MTLLDRFLCRMGLTRLSKVPRIEVFQRGQDRRYLKIKFSDGHFVAGYLDAEVISGHCPHQL